MKKLLSLLTITFLFASCSKTIDEAYLVPKDAIGVMYINLESLSKKSQDLDFSKLSINTIIEDKAPEEIKDFVNQLMTQDNINNTFRKEYILGFGSFKRMSGVGGLILPIKDAASFEAFIKPMIDKLSNLEKEDNVGKDNAYTVYSDREFAIGYNDKTALIIGANNYAAAELKDLTDLERQESILATNYFDDFFDTKQDIGVHVTSTPLGDTFDGILNAFSGFDIDLENNNITYYGSFENDHLHTDTKLKLNNDIKSLIAYDKWMTTSYSKSMLNALPNDPLVVTKMSIDFEAFYEHIVSLQDNKLLPVQIREELKKNMERSDREASKEIGMTTSDFTALFDETIMFALTEGKTVKDSVYSYDYYSREESYKLIEKKVPNMYGAIAIKDKSKVSNFLSLIKEKGAPLQEISKDYYRVDNEAFVVITDDLILITNDEERASQMKNNGQLTNNLSDFKHKDKLSHSMYVYSKGNIGAITNDFSSSLTNMFNPYGRYNTYDSNNAMSKLSETSNELYEKYYGEIHYFVDVDGSESFLYTKGGKNSLIQSIKYGDELAKTMSTFEDDLKEEEVTEEVIEEIIEIEEVEETTN
ncbi:DUF4836 family protein [Olleya sp. YSTF-M6]|uniref:DUF4836 family protein n=1 Tax=Olleya sediminilitoris TaxID=2795739 RepID=A0ABS1WMW0_9FLAO|nr:DUF4836 family protein [Olleya sediminilitoris]MBL7560449.1 DUF4836 family protein [Olleya sediminilitoris]